jgi:hypothetical protein
MAAMPVIGIALQAKDKGVSKNAMIEAVMSVLIAVIMMGILVVIIGS